MSIACGGPSAPVHVPSSIDHPLRVDIKFHPSSLEGTSGHADHCFIRLIALHCSLGWLTRLTNN